ncbi:MAG: hypothetical protein AAF481_07910 [Acidobacteriota bacterium]
MATDFLSPTAVGDLRRFADAAVKQLPIFRLPRTQALLHVLRTVQSLQVSNEFGAAVRGRVEGGYAGMRYSQDLLRWLVFKIFTWCPPGGKQTLTSPDDVKVALEAVTDFAVYSHLQDGIVSAEAGFFLCDIDSTKRIIRFSPNPSIEAQQAERQLREEFQRTKEVFELLQEAEDLPPEATRGLLRTVRFDANSMTLSYRATGRVLKAFAEGLELSEPQLPPTLSVGPYSLDDFWVVWKHLAAHCAALNFLLVLACKELEGEWTGHNSAALVLPRDRIVGQLRHHYSLRSPVALEVLRDLTYDIGVRWTDVMYQPLIPLTSRELVTIPVLVLGSNPERNLLAIIDSLPRKDHELKDVREDLMIREIAPLFDPERFVLIERLELGPRAQREGEIDLLVLDKRSNEVLAISLKWFYGPDSMHEVRVHDDWFREGLAKHATCLEYLRGHAEELAEKRSDLGHLSTSTLVLGILVSKTCVPSELLRDPEIPVVTQEQFVRQVRGGVESLSGFYRQLSDKPALPDNVEYRQTSRELEFGGWTVTIPRTEWQRFPIT